MNLLQLVMKQMRQRALSTWLTLLSVLLGVGLAVAIMIIRRQGAAIFGQTDYGYDVLVGAKGSPLQLVLNTVYHLDKSPGNIPYSLYQQLTSKYLGDVHTAVPFVVGDSYQNHAIVGTFPTLFDTPLTRIRDAINGEQDMASTIQNLIQENQPVSSTDLDFPTQQSALRDELAGALPMVAQYIPSTAATIQQALDQMDAAAKLGSDLSAGSSEIPKDNGILKALQTVATTLEPAQKAFLDYFGIDPSLNLRTVGPLPYRPDKYLQIGEGRAFAADKFEAVLGYDIPRLTQNPTLKIGDSFKATHGFPAPGQKPDIHPSIWKVVGVLKQTHTAADRVVYIPLITFYTIAEHGAGLVAQHAIRTNQDPNAAIKEMQQIEAKKKSSAPGGELMQSANAPPPAAPVDDDDVKHYTVDANGRIHLDSTLPRDVWGLSGVMVKTRSPALVMGLMYNINNGEEAAAVNPASTMRQFFAIFLEPSTIVLQVIVALTTIVAGVGILVSIYNSVSARLREIAILRALGATRVRILTLICVEAGLIGLIGGFLGLIAGHLLGLVGSIALDHMIGEGFNWVATDYWEWLYLLAVVILAVLAGLVPAMKAYKTPVATNLTAS